MIYIKGAEIGVALRALDRAPHADPELASKMRTAIDNRKSIPLTPALVAQLNEGFSLGVNFPEYEMPAARSLNAKIARSKPASAWGRMVAGIARSLRTSWEEICG